MLSLTSARLMAIDIARRKRRSPKTLRFSRFSEVTLKPNATMRISGRSSTV